ncbi:hypothetical protein ACP70R_042432 [Stipagrostis hirtigluma subsp. patula]
MYKVLAAQNCAGNLTSWSCSASTSAPVHFVLTNSTFYSKGCRKFVYGNDNDWIEQRIERRFVGLELPFTCPPIEASMDVIRLPHKKGFFVGRRKKARFLDASSSPWP